MMKRRLLSKRLYLACLFMFTGMNVQAQVVKMRDLFATMPDSLLPMVTRNNRLDCIDFMENHMQARVKNKVDQYVELKKLTEDYLLFQTSRKGCLEMKYVPDTDTTGVLYLVRTYMGPIADSHVQCFRQDWAPLAAPVARPQVEDFFSIPSDVPDGALNYILAELRDLTFLKASLSENDARLTWEISLEHLSREDRSTARRYVKPVVQQLP